MKNHILLIEDDEHINGIIYEGLIQEGFSCTQAYSGTEGQLHVTHTTYDLIILDLMLPGLTGERFIEQLRGAQQCHTPVIVLSAKDELDHKLNLFELGADDYVTKPFNIQELIARIQVHIKRTTKQQATNEFRHKNLVLNDQSYAVDVNGTLLNFTRQEFKIMELLLKHPSRVFTKQDLYQLAWDDMYIGEDKTLSVHISNLRNKIKLHCNENYIDTVWGIGFRLGK